MEIVVKYNTDITNSQSGEGFSFIGEELKIKQKDYDKSYTFGQILDIAREKRAFIIIKTKPSKRYPNGGKWYIKEIMFPQSLTDLEKYEYTKKICEQNELQKKWNTRECYLIDPSIFEIKKFYNFKSEYNNTKEFLLEEA